MNYELRIMNVGFGILSPGICLLIESEDVVGSQSTDEICGRIEEGARMCGLLRIWEL